MSKSARIGEMHTKVQFFSKTKGIDSDGYPTEVWINVFGQNAKVWCKWTYTHGTEALENMRLGVKDTATITMRYSPLINVECQVQHESDTERYEVISIDNVNDAREFLEIIVRKVVTA